MLALLLLPFAPTPAGLDLADAPPAACRRRAGRTARVALVGGGPAWASPG